MPWEDGLTQEQRAPVAYHGGHARLIAGPGTGKTLVLTRRAQYLITELGVAPDELLVLTFTRAATAELRARLRQNLGPDTRIPRISTLHSFALRQLLQNPQYVSLPSPLRIADDYEQRWIVEEDMARILSLRIRDVQALFHRLSNDWERLAVEAPGWEEAFERDHPRFVGAWREHRNVFGYTLRSELVYQLKASLEQHEMRVDRPRHLLIDEYQDLNACDQAIVQRLAVMGTEIFAAGDDDQSIYGFRFALPDGIRQFPERFEGATSLDLRTCHRCGGRILRTGLFVAEQDPRRMPKVIVPREGAPDGVVYLFRFVDNQQEAQAVGQICEWLIATSGLQPRDILILFRSDRGNVFSDPIRRSLEAIGIPVQTKTDPLAPLNEPGKPGRQLIALLRLVGDPLDSLAWRTLLKERKNDLGEETLFRVYEFARQAGRRFSQVLDDVGMSIGAKGRTLGKEVATIREMLRSIGQPAEGNIDVWLDQVARTIIAEDSVRAEVLSVIQKLKGEADVQSLDQLLRALGASLGEFEQERAEDNVVTLMTMHQAKGLTAEAVIIVAAEEEYIPGRAVGGADIDDARRLLYVSMTRARQFLFVTFCNRRYGQQAHTGSRPGRNIRHLTPFLQGVPGVPITVWQVDTLR